MTLLAIMMTGCGSTRQEHTRTVETTRETTTTNDGHVTTKVGQRIMDENTDAKTELDIKPSASDVGFLGSLVGLFTGGGIERILNMVLAMWAAGSTMTARAANRRADYHADSENELWVMHKRNLEE